MTLVSNSCETQHLSARRVVLALAHAGSSGDGTDTITDNGVTIARVVVNGECTRDPENNPLLIGYAAPVAVGTVVDGGKDTIQFGRGIAVSDLLMRFEGNDLVVAIKDPLHPEWGIDQLSDKIRLVNWLDPLKRVETFRFADGTVLGVQDIAALAQHPSGAPVSFTEVTLDANGLVTGIADRLTVATDAADTVVGTADADIVLGNAGNDTITGNGGNDVIDGGSGTDTMAGGTGNDTYIVDAAGDVVTENASEGTDTVETALASYTLGANVENVVGTGTAGQELNGNALDNVIVGGAGYDTYLFARGDSQDIIVNGVAGNPGASGELDFASGIATDQLWFKQSGDDLLIQVMQIGRLGRALARPSTSRGDATTLHRLDDEGGGHGDGQWQDLRHFPQAGSSASRDPASLGTTLGTTWLAGSREALDPAYASQVGCHRDTEIGEMPFLDAQQSHLGACRRGACCRIVSATMRGRPSDCSKSLSRWCAFSARAAVTAVEMEEATTTVRAADRESDDGNRTQGAIGRRAHVHARVCKG